MISRCFLASGAVVAATGDAGSLQTVKNVLLIIFLAIGAVWLFVDIRRNLTATYGGAAAPLPAPLPATAAPVACAAPAASAVDERPSPEVLAVLAAAVHCTMGANSRIVAISGVDDDTQSWAAEGRRAIYATRKVR
jgi:hypothetical protein